MLVPVYIAFIGLAFLTGLITYTRKTSPYVAIIIFILGADLVLEICANYFVKYLNLKNNNGIYSIVMLIEFWFYPLYYRQVLINKSIKRLISGYLVVFPVFWFLLVFVLSGADTWNSYISITGTIVLISLSVCMYYQLFTGNVLIRLITHFEFVIASGLIIFFACTYTVLGMLNHVVQINLPLARQLLKLLHILNIVYYGIVCYAFICSYATTLTKNSRQVIS
jgi:hypothetical protein